MGSKNRALQPANEVFPSLRLRAPGGLPIRMFVVLDRRSLRAHLLEEVCALSAPPAWRALPCLIGVDKQNLNRLGDRVRTSPVSTRRPLLQRPAPSPFQQLNSIPSERHKGFISQSSRVLYELFALLNSTFIQSRLQGGGRASPGRSPRYRRPASRVRKSTDSCGPNP